MSDSAKPLRQPFYLGSEARMETMRRLRLKLGLTSDSELLRRLVDDAAEREGVSQQLGLGLTTPPRGGW